MGKLHEDNDNLDDAKRFFVRVLEEFKDVPNPYSEGATLWSSAQAALRRINALRVGNAAPNIKGKDIAGVEFQLSDYRGKVVMLDFWGHW